MTTTAPTMEVTHVDNPNAATTVTWAALTGTDLRRFFGLSRDELDALHDLAETQVPGSWWPDKDQAAAAPTCDNPKCAATLIPRGPSQVSKTQAYLGMWWEHPPVPGVPGPGPGIGHTSFAVIQNPSEAASRAAERYVGKARQ